MAPQKTLQAFLAAARAALTAPASKRSTPLHFVVGNESADLDSLCSALLLAYLRSHEPPHTLHIPLCHIPRDDLALRPEFSAVLKHADAAVTSDDVLTLTELPGDGDGLRPEDTRWLLVDHNAMTGALGQTYARRVVGCIDHHDDEGKVPRDAVPRVVEKTGSCMSLVVAQCAGAWDALAKAKDDDDDDMEGRRINRGLGFLALAPILIDTSNLGNRDKTTARDEHAVAVAEARILAAGSGSGSGEEEDYDRDRFFDEVSRLKEDISRMSIHDILRKDYKEWTTSEGDDGSGLRLGTSSAPQSFAFLVEKAGGEGAFVKELEQWSAGKGLDVTVVLTTHKDDSGRFCRELLVWARTGPDVVEAVKKFVGGEGKEKLGLGTWGHGKLDEDDGEGSWRRCWTQAKMENSRKQIAPMLRDALKGVKT
ncbi:DHH phosphoesterase [Hypoxylon sp. FL1150]|nr:DHH phosphoesterase [Hypoxylon sp. FL1150]